jgi:ferredoxin
MAFWFYRGLRRGIATTRYPKAIDPWTEQLPSPPAFHSARLTPRLVDALIESCPARALSRDQRELVLDLGGCTGCGRCVELSGGAAEPSGEFLLAATDRQQLVKRIAIPGEEDTDGRR